MESGFFALLKSGFFSRSDWKSPDKCSRCRWVTNDYDDDDDGADDDDTDDVNNVLHCGEKW